MHNAIPLSLAVLVVCRDHCDRLFLPYISCSESREHLVSSRQHPMLTLVPGYV